MAAYFAQLELCLDILEDITDPTPEIQEVLDHIEEELRQLQCDPRYRVAPPALGMVS